MASEYKMASEVLEIERARLALERIIANLKAQFTIQDWEFYRDVQARKTTKGG